MSSLARNDRRDPENISSLRVESTKKIVINLEGIRMFKDGEN